MDAPSNDVKIPQAASSLPRESLLARPGMRPGITIRPGMATRLGIGFAALAATILAANLVIQKSNLDARAHMRELVVQHEPIVRSSELLANALSDYEHNVMAYAEGRSSSVIQVEEAARRLADAAAAYSKLHDQDASRQGSMRQLADDLELYRTLGTALIKQADARRARISEYRSQFARVESRVNAPQERATRFAGGVFASQALLELSRTLNVMREKFTAAILDRNLIAPRPLINAENAFAQVLQLNSDNLIKTQGVQWLAYLKVEYSSLLSARGLALDSTAGLQARTTEFRDQGVAVSGIVRNQLIEPARRSLSDASNLADRVAVKADRQLATISFVVLALFIAIGDRKSVV